MLDITIEKLVYGGDGLARLDGRVVLTPFVLPGEQARVAVTSEKPSLVRGSLAELLAAAPERVAAQCAYFGRCGGCHYQHASYEAQVAAKVAILREEMRRLGKIEAPEEIPVVSGEPFGYRNRAQLHIEGKELGYREAQSHKLCAIEHCPIGSPRINEVIRVLRGMLQDSRWPRFIQSIEIFTNEEQVQVTVLETQKPVAKRFFEWCAEMIPGFAPGEIEYGEFRVSGRSFFQSNRFLVNKLVETALDGVSGESALDLYAGVGLFSLPLARKFQSVIAVESGSGAVRDLIFNAGRAGLQVGVEQNSADLYLEKLDRAPDFVLLDPPRSGIGKSGVKQLARLKPETVVIVACDPATLARDLAGLLAAGYALDRMTLVDLFPQTYHIETVVRLRAIHE